MKFISEIFESFNHLKKQQKLFVLGFLVLGSLIRLSQLFHLGFVFDTVDTQYIWGKSAHDMGTGEFWRNYPGFFDYWPGSLNLLTLLYLISRLFGGNPEAFVVILKLFNWFFEIVFILLAAFIARKYGNWDSKKILVFASFLYILPAIWFVGVGWGQFDTFLVSLGLISILVLYKSLQRETSNQKYLLLAFLSGIIMGAALWVKLQIVLLFPALALFYVYHRNIKMALTQLGGILISSAVLIAIPVLYNNGRLINSIRSPIDRIDRVTEGAATFWVMLGYNFRMGTDSLFDFWGRNITISKMGMYLFVLLSLVFVIRLAGFKLRELKEQMSHPVQTFKSYFNQPLPFHIFCMVMTITSSMYFMFLTKMHSRYLHFGLLFAFLTFAGIKSSAAAKIWFAGACIMSFGYFLNQIYVFDTSSLAGTELAYTKFHYYLPGEPIMIAAGLHFVGLVIMYIVAVSNRLSEKVS